MQWKLQCKSALDSVDALDLVSVLGKNRYLIWPLGWDCVIFVVDGLCVYMGGGGVVKKPGAVVGFWS